MGHGGGKFKAGGDRWILKWADRGWLVEGTTQRKRVEGVWLRAAGGAPAGSGPRPAGAGGCQRHDQGSVHGEGSGMVNRYVGRPGKEGKWARHKMKISNSNFKPIQLVQY
jgi:hypothetical protein